MTHEERTDRKDERDEAGRLCSVVVEGRRFYYVPVVAAELASLRGVVQAVRDLRQKYSGWVEPVPVRELMVDLRAALAAAADAPQPEDPR